MIDSNWPDLLVSGHFALYLKIMKKVLLALPLCMSIVGLHAQDTYLQVYDIISAKCGSCHIEAHESGLT